MNISVLVGDFGPTPPEGRRRRRNLKRTLPGLDQPAVKEADRIKRYFSEFKDDYKYEKPLANGRHGVATLVTQRERPELNRLSRRFVVKRAYDDKGEDLLREEIEVIDRLRGAPHIVQPLYLDPDPFDKLSRPTLILEYVENGTLADFIDRIKVDESYIPNRVLLGFFSCLTRALIAMAWPDRGVEGAAYQNEMFPQGWDKIPMTQLYHGDLHQDNVLIGDLSPPADEHNLTPILKLIDFSQAKIYPDVNKHDLGVKTNIYDVGRIMRMLITLDTTWDTEPVSVTFPNRDIPSTSAMICEPNYPWLDNDLRNLVVLCTAVDAADRPTLDYVSTTIDGLMKDKKQTGERERTKRIQDLVQDFIFYADW